MNEAMAKITPDPRKQIDQLQAQAKGQMDEAMAKITPEPRKQIDQLQAQAKGQMDEAMTKMTPDQRKQMAQMMAKLNPEQRKQMEAMMSGHGNAASLGAKKEQGPQLKWEPVGGSQQIAGFPCHGFKLMRDGKTSAEGCYISWDAGAIAKSDLAPMKKMGEFFLSAAGANAGDLIGQQLEQWDKL